MRSASRGCWRRPHRVAKTRGTGWRIAGGIRWRNRVEQGGENPWNPHHSRLNRPGEPWVGELVGRDVDRHARYPPGGQLSPSGDFSARGPKDPRPDLIDQPRLFGEGDE